MVRLFETKPERFLLYVLVGQVLLWTLIPFFCFANAPLDVVQNVGWGREWQMGYYKGPPLQAWLTQIALLAGSGRLITVYLFSQVAIVLTQLALFNLGRDLVGMRGALWAVVLFSLVYYANLPTPEFNAAIVQMPLWAWAAVSLHRAIVGKEPLWWILLAALTALSLYTGYGGLALIGALAFATVAHAHGRAALRTPWPWLTLVLAVVILAPELKWLYVGHFQPLTYARQIGAQAGAGGRAIHAARFAGGLVLAQALAVALLLIAGAGLRRGGANAEGDVAVSADDRRFILVLIFVPVLLSILGALIGGFSLRGMAAAPMAVWISLAAVIWLNPPARLKLALPVWAVLFVLIPVGAGAYGVAGGARPKPPRVSLPGPMLAQSLTEVWFDNTGRRLDLVAGDPWATGIIATYSRDRPTVFIDGNWRWNPWVTPQRLADSGAMIVWAGGEQIPAKLQSLGPFPARGSVAARYRYGRKLASLHWAMRAPASLKLAPPLPPKIELLPGPTP